MSLPPAPLPAMAATSIAINPLEHAFMAINTNPYFIGLMMLLLNLGGRFIGMEMSKEQERTFQHPWIRKFFIFTVFFVATRNILVALALTIVTLLLLAYLLNETSDFYIFGTKTVESPPQIAPQDSATGGLTFEEKEILKRLTEKQAKFAAAGNGFAPSNPSDTNQNVPSAEQNYFENLTHLQQ